MTRRPRARARQQQINILHTETRQRHTRKQMAQGAAWFGLVLAMIVAVGVTVQLGLNFLLEVVLYTNPRYVLNKIEIEPRNHFDERLIRQAAGLEPGQNLWSLNLPQIAQDLEKLPNVSSATIERHFPDKISVVIHERVPVVKIVLKDAELGTKETYYLDHDCVVLKPRADEKEPARPLPEIFGLANTGLEPGSQLEKPPANLSCALQILDKIDHDKLHTVIDIREINLDDPLAITMVTTRGMRITFRLDYIEQQLTRLQQAFDYADSLQRTIATIDLTPDRNDPVTFYE